MFQTLKFLQLRTPSTDVRRRMKYAEDRNWLNFWTASLLNRILANKFSRALARFLDYYLIKNPEFAAYFERHRPNLLICGNLFTEAEIHFLRAAKKRGVPAIGFINSWDKVTARCILRLLPDKAIVFNDIVKDELIRHDDMKEENIFVGGMPHFDAYIEGAKHTREDFLKEFGLSKQIQLIVYAPIGSAWARSDWAMIDLLRNLNARGAFGPGAAILVRFPPNDFVDERELQKRPNLLYDIPGVRFSHKRGNDWDLDTDMRDRLADTLAHMSLLIGYTSSIVIDSVFFGKPVICINFELDNAQPIYMQPTAFYYPMTHCQHILTSSAVRVADSVDELSEWVRRYLKDPDIDREKRIVLKQRQCVFADGHSGERIGKYILGFVKAQ